MFPMISVLGGLIILYCAANTTTLAILTAAEELAGNLLNIIDQVQRLSSRSVSSISSGTNSRFYRSTNSSATASPLSYLASPTLSGINVTNLLPQTSLTNSTATNSIRAAITVALLFSLILLSHTEVETPKVQ